MKIHKHTLTGGDVTYDGELNTDVLKDVDRCEILCREFINSDNNSSSAVQVLTFALIKKDGKVSVTCCANMQELAIIQTSLERAGIETIDKSSYDIDSNQDIDVITF